MRLHKIFYALYPAGYITNWLLKVGFVILQIIIALASFYFQFYICSNDLFSSYFVLLTHHLSLDIMGTIIRF